MNDLTSLPAQNRPAPGPTIWKYTIGKSWPPDRAPCVLWQDARMSDTRVTPSRRLVFRGLAFLWLVFASLVIAALAGEVWLRFQWSRAWKISEPFRTGNVFFAHSNEMNAGNRGLWHKPWRKYEPGAKLEMDTGGQHFRIEINSLGY